MLMFSRPSPMFCSASPSPSYGSCVHPSLQDRYFQALAKENQYRRRAAALARARREQETVARYQQEQELIRRAMLQEEEERREQEALRIWRARENALRQRESHPPYNQHRRSLFSPFIFFGNSEDEMESEIVAPETSAPVPISIQEPEAVPEVSMLDTYNSLF